MKQGKEKGITLIALVVTIIVLLILAGVTLSLVSGENGILKRATSAVSKNEIASAEEQANLVISELATQYYEAKYGNHTSDLGTVDDYIAKQLEEPRTTEGGYTVKYETEKGFVVSKGETELSMGTIKDGKVGWTGSTGEGITIPSKPENPEPDNSMAGKTDTSKNRNLAGTTTGYSYKNPVIPQGFSAVDAGATWTYADSSKTEVTGWNDGLVIEDGIGNQFVWVPVDGMDVPYAKWCTVGISHLSCSDDTSACPVSDETAQITTYQGFYVARYEAGLEGGDNTQITNNIDTTAPISQVGKKVWNYIDYYHATVAAKLMVNNENTYGNNKSGLMTGTQWDTIMKWYDNSGIKVDATQKWGTYYDLEYSERGKYFTASNASWKEGEFLHKANTSPVIVHASGLNANGIHKNIVDLGGNLKEWTAELYSFSAVLRGGEAGSEVATYPTSGRNCDGRGTYRSQIGFRPVLYIQ